MNPGNVARYGGACATVILLATSSGCIGRRADRETLLHAQAAVHVYHRPAPEVAAAVRALLVEKGFALTPSSNDMWLRTQWKRTIDDDEFASFRERYVVFVKRLTAHHCRVEAARFTLTTVGMETYHPLSMSKPDGQHSQGTASYGAGLLPLAAGPRTGQRDTAFEWDLLRRVDPTGAHWIEAIATRSFSAPRR